MNSAAKLRTAGRATAVLASAALVMTSFGPAAFAWTADAGAGAATTAGVASIGLIDADRSADGTQGARMITPGANDQEIGDVRFVLPSTWQAGDTVTFTLAGDTGGAVTDQISFSALPAVTIDSTPYDASTHVQATSPVPLSGAAAGSTEAGRETRYSGTGTPVAPTFTPTLTSDGAGQFNNRITLTFTNSSNPLVSGAKFIGAINGAKVNVGSTVTSNRDLGLTMAAIAAIGTDDPISTGVDYTTYPATIATVGMNVTNGGVVADNTYQFVGPVTVTSASTLTGPVSFSVETGNFDPNATITATQYDAGGRVIGTPAPAQLSNNNSTVTVSAAANATRIEFKGMALRVPAGTQTVRYTLDTQGAATGDLGSLTAQNLGGAADTATTQTDIDRPSQLTETQATTTVVPTRIGGTNRFETAVKIAEADRGTTVGQIRGEADNVVIASGQAFPDALSAGYLAATKDAPVLLTERGELPSTVVEFLKNYGAKNVFVVGGSAAVADRVETQLRNLQSYDVQVQERMETVTETRYRTTLAAPSAGSITPSSAQDLTQNNTGSWSFAVTRASTASAETITGATLTLPDTRVVTGTLTNPGTNGAAGAATFAVDGVMYTLNIPAATAASTTIKAAATTQQVQTSTEQPVQGGTALTDRTATGAARKVVPLNANLQVTRIGGDNRFHTNRLVNEYAGVTSATPIGTMVGQYGQAGKKTALVANGLVPWDALAAGPLVGNGAGNPVPLVLTGGSTLNSEAKRQMQTMDIGHALLIGGDAVIPGAVSSELQGVGTTSTRLSGADRWGTARAISEFALRPAGATTVNAQPGLGFGSHSPLLVNGGLISLTQADNTKWADALTAGPWAARESKIMALTTTNTLPEATEQMLRSNAATLEPLTAIGLGMAVSTETLNKANAAVAN